MVNNLLWTLHAVALLIGADLESVLLYFQSPREQWPVVQRENQDLLCYFHLIRRESNALFRTRLVLICG